MLFLRKIMKYAGLELVRKVPNIDDNRYKKTL